MEPILPPPSLAEVLVVCSALLSFVCAIAAILHLTYNVHRTNRVALLYAIACGLVFADMAFIFAPALMMDINHRLIMLAAFLTGVTGNHIFYQAGAKLATTT